MIRFFVRLAIAALADWFTWQISTSEMRFHREQKRYFRRITRVMKATTPMAQELSEAIRGMSGVFSRFAEWQAKERRDA